MGYHPGGPEKLGMTEQLTLLLEERELILFYSSTDN